MTRHFTTSACRSPYVSFGRRGASGTPTTTLRRGASSPSMPLAWLMSLAAVVICAAGAAPAQADLAAVSTVAAPPGLDPAGTGLAAWYQDANGMQLTLCDDGTPACPGATPATLTDPAGGELFYNR